MSKYKYKLVNDNDCDFRLDLRCTVYEEALEEALGILGWHTVRIKGEDEDE